ncbi:acyl-CoA-like ligand-binding transcription factor [Amycolatopsis alkalitolerans]|uniref:TetR family transcriptional regulator n=1 Tax=Amycolatopsis alkalitolerans TaxID=2547244 RepID=A0A5C4LXC3_9PSEU|nr:TetR family transcriptional regulator [Amycolatopsis alkalitolerans]TNC22903.1 TetR family transcriptional regulator [Amycolatopsis alkalitolerans]
MSSSPGEPGLRERKKARTRAAIQDHALRLFIEQGYAETTIEQIAAAADVSQSTFFRYFPTKEDTVRYDRLDPVMIEAFVAQPAGLSPAAAVRASFKQVLDSLPAEESELERARQRLIFSVPELRVRLVDQLSEGIAMFNDGVARRLGRDPDDIAVRTWTGVIIGVVMSAYFASPEDPDRWMVELDERLACLEGGLPE